MWLRMKNRPLDEDDIPREPIETDGPEVAILGANFYGSFPPAIAPGPE